MSADDIYKTKVGFNFSKDKTYHLRIIDTPPKQPGLSDIGQGLYMKIKKLPVYLFFAGLGMSSQLYAEGYKLYEQSVSSMGNAYAGRGAQITDATLVYSNPAALPLLSGSQFSGGLNLIDVKTDFSNASANSAGGMPVDGQSSGTVTLTELVPFIFYSAPVSEQLSWGVGLYVPFGLSSDYDEDWIGRYFADETSIQVVSIQASAGYRLSDTLSLGFGLSVNHAEGKLSKYKDHNGLCELGTSINGLYGADVYNAAYCDSHYQVKGDDIGFGYTLGLHSQPRAGTRLAIMYHSAVRYTLKGDSVITNTPILGASVAGNEHFLSVGPTLPAIDLRTGKLAANSQLTEASKLHLTTPATLTFALDQQLTPQWSVQLSANWTEWSEFQSIDILSDDASPSISLSTQVALNYPGQIGYIPEYWRNSWSYSVGTTYQHQPDLTLKAGIAYDENPIRQERKTARIPTTHRTWLTAGANWKISAKMSLDVAYGYMFMNDVSILEHEYNVQNEALYSSSLTADYQTKAQLFAVQFNYLF